MGRRPARPAYRASRARPRQPGDPAGGGPRDPAHRLPAPPVPACGRLRADAGASRRDRTHRQCGDAGPHLHRMGQGRHRHDRPSQGRRAGAWHADLPPARPRLPARGFRRRLRDPGRHPAGAAGRLRDAIEGRFRRRVPGREPGADVDAAAPEAEGILRSGRAGRHRAARPDPGRHGPSLPAPALWGGGSGLPHPPPQSTGRRTNSRRC